MFLHHYLPSFVFSTLVMVNIIDGICRVYWEDAIVAAQGDIVLSQKLPFKLWIRSEGGLLFVGFLMGVFSVAIWSFIQFSPMTYGFEMESRDEIRGCRGGISIFQHA